jgi:hypothetical protein
MNDYHALQTQSKLEISDTTLVSLTGVDSQRVTLEKSSFIPRNPQITLKDRTFQNQL